MDISRLRCAAVAAALLTAGCGTLPAVPATRTPSPSPTTSTPSPTPSPTPSRTTLNVVGLGDSVTSGEHCDCDDYVTGFGNLLAKQAGIRVDVTNDGESGSTSDGLANELTGTGKDDESLQSDVAQADVVVITMGANDLAPALSAWESGSCPHSCYTPDVEQMQSDLSRVLTRVHKLGGGHARVLVTTYWNVFTDGDVAKKAESSGYLTWSDTITRHANSAIAEVAAAHGATLVDLYAPFKGDGDQDPTSLLASDGDHPDAAGTALISRTVLAAYDGGH